VGVVVAVGVGVTVGVGVADDVDGLGEGAEDLAVCDGDGQAAQEQAPRPHPGRGGGGNRCRHRLGRDRRCSRARRLSFSALAGRGPGQPRISSLQHGRRPRHQQRDDDRQPIADRHGVLHPWSGAGDHAVQFRDHSQAVAVAHRQVLGPLAETIDVISDADAHGDAHTDRHDYSHAIAVYAIAYPYYYFVAGVLTAFAGWLAHHGRLRSAVGGLLP
jgi:hypothetical protein